jgi:predicted RNase H-like HicB family nuclease
MANYIMLITYSFDGDYVSVPCETEEEAIQKMNEYLKEEVETVIKESEYIPIVKRYDDSLEAELFYIDNEMYIDTNTDIGRYKVIKIDHLA